jgi:hypothetical protein
VRAQSRQLCVHERRIFAAALVERLAVAELLNGGVRDLDSNPHSAGSFHSLQSDLDTIVVLHAAERDLGPAPRAGQHHHGQSLRIVRTATTDRQIGRYGDGAAGGNL